MMAREIKDHSPTPPFPQQVDAPPGIFLQSPNPSQSSSVRNQQPHLSPIPSIKHIVEAFRHHFVYGTSNFSLIAGNAAMTVAFKVAQQLQLDKDHIPQNPNHFANNEMNIYIPPDHVASRDVYTIQSTNGNHEVSLTRLKLLMESAKGNGANRNTAIVLHLPYARQDRRAKPGQAEAARLTEQEIFRAGSHNPDKKWSWQHETRLTAKTNLIVVDIHSTTPLETITKDSKYQWANLDPALVLQPRMQEIIDTNNLEVAIAFPDETAAQRYVAYAEKFGGGMEKASIIKKKRDVNKNNSVSISEDQESCANKVAGKDVFIIDDIADTLGTVLQAAKKLKEDGARSVRVIATHGVFSGEALSRMDDEAIDGIIVTDTIQQQIQHPKLEVVSIAPLIAEVIRHIENREPLGGLVKSQSPDFEKSYRRWKVNRERRKVRRQEKTARRNAN